jgi:hypothetical protein
VRSIQRRSRRPRHRNYGGASILQLPPPCRRRSRRCQTSLDPSPKPGFCTIHRQYSTQYVFKGWKLDFQINYCHFVLRGFVTLSADGIIFFFKDFPMHLGVFCCDRRRITMFALRRLTSRTGGSPSSLFSKLLDTNNYLKNCNANCNIQAVGFASVHGNLTDTDRVFTNLYGR